MSGKETSEMDIDDTSYTKQLDVMNVKMCELIINAKMDDAGRKGLLEAFRDLSNISGMSFSANTTTDKMAGLVQSTT